MPGYNAPGKGRGGKQTGSSGPGSPGCPPLPRQRYKEDVVNFTVSYKDDQGRSATVYAATKPDPLLGPDDEFGSVRVYERAAARKHEFGAVYEAEYYSLEDAVQTASSVALVMAKEEVR